jgi:hypothetical protein
MGNINTRYRGDDGVKCNIVRQPGPELWKCDDGKICKSNGVYAPDGFDCGSVCIVDGKYVYAPDGFKCLGFNHVRTDVTHETRSLHMDKGNAIYVGVLRGSIGMFVITVLLLAFGLWRIEKRRKTYAL